MKKCIIMLLSTIIILGGVSCRKSPSTRLPSTNVSSTKSSSDIWYDFGNGIINLSAVKFITSNMTVYVMDDNGGNENLCNTAISEQDIKQLEENLKRYKGKFYVSASANIKFDNFTLKLSEINYTYRGKNNHLVSSEDVIELIHLWDKNYQEVKQLLNK